MSPHASDRKLDALEQLRADPQSDATLEALRKALRDRSSLVVAKAARLAAEFRLPQLLPDLTTAFDRLMMNAARADPQCWGKTAIVKAMKALGPEDAGVFCEAPLTSSTSRCGAAPRTLPPLCEVRALPRSWNPA